MVHKSFPVWGTFAVWAVLPALFIIIIIIIMIMIMMFVTRLVYASGKPPTQMWLLS